MGRPFVIVAGLIAYAVGAAMAYHRLGSLDMSRLATGLLIMVFAILTAHYANEYADRDTDRTTRRTRFSGGSGVLASGALPAKWALVSAVLFLIVASVATVMTVAAGYFTSTLGAMVAVGLIGG